MTTERQLSQAVEDILVNRPNGEASIAVLIREIPKVIDLTDADYRPSLTRSGESMWEQRVRNITSHKNTSTNYIYLGYLEQTSGGLRITDAGRLHQKARKSRLG